MYQIMIYYKNKDGNSKSPVASHLYCRQEDYDAIYKEFIELKNIYEDMEANEVLFSPSMSKTTFEKLIKYIITNDKQLVTIIKV